MTFHRKGGGFSRNWILKRQSPALSLHGASSSMLTSQRPHPLLPRCRLAVAHAHHEQAEPACAGPGLQRQLVPVQTGSWIGAVFRNGSLRIPGFVPAVSRSGLNLQRGAALCKSGLSLSCGSAEAGTEPGSDCQGVAAAGRTL